MRRLPVAKLDEVGWVIRSGEATLVAEGHLGLASDLVGGRVAPTVERADSG